MDVCYITIVSTNDGENLTMTMTLIFNNILHSALLHLTSPTLHVQPASPIGNQNNIMNHLKHPTTFHLSYICQRANSYLDESSVQYL